MLGFGFSGFGLLRFIFIAAFVIIGIAVIFIFIAAIRQARINDKSPRLTVDAVVVSKRKNTTNHQNPVGGDISGAHGYTTSTSSDYYVTFQVESGDCMEFHVNRSEYDELEQGKAGRLSFQGTRFLGFIQLIA